MDLILKSSFPRVSPDRHEHKDMLEINLFIDQVLRTGLMFSHGEDRNIVFSTFAPDICSNLIH